MGDDAAAAFRRGDVLLEVAEGGGGGCLTGVDVTLVGDEVDFLAKKDWMDGVLFLGEDFFLALALPLLVALVIAMVLVDYMQV